MLRHFTTLRLHQSRTRGTNVTVAWEGKRTSRENTRERHKRRRRRDRRGNWVSCRIRLRTCSRGCAVNIRESLLALIRLVECTGADNFRLFHRASEYNNLKRAVAAAPLGGHLQQQSQGGVQHVHPPMPPFRHAHSADPFSLPTQSHSHSRPVVPLARTASAGALHTPQPIRAPAPQVAARTPQSSSNPPRSTLTPSLARVNFEFSLNSQPTTSATPVQVEQTSAADKKTVETILDDLIEGEPVKVVERTPTKVVVSETIPTQPQPPNQNNGRSDLLPGMQIVNGVPVKTSVSHPIK